MSFRKLPLPIPMIFQKTATTHANPKLCQVDISSLHLNVTEVYDDEDDDEDNDDDDDDDNNDDDDDDGGGRGKGWRSFASILLPERNYGPFLPPISPLPNSCLLQAWLFRCVFSPVSAHQYC